MDHIDQVLGTHIIEKVMPDKSVKTVKLQPAIRASLALAKKTLNKYYSKTDFTDTYRIAMGTFGFTL